MLGTRLVFDLIKQGDRVRALYRHKKRIAQFSENCRFYCENPDEFMGLIEWVKADLLDYNSLCEATRGVDMVIHTAAMVSFDPADREVMYEVNIDGTANLVNACLLNGVKRIAHVSSIAALGKEENGKMIDEKSAWVPGENHSGYSIGKFHSEMEIWRGINEGLSAVIVNPSVILGPGEWHSGSPAFFNNTYKGMKFYPKGGTGFVDVRDVSAALLLLTSEENWDRASQSKYLLNAENLYYKEVFSEIARSLGVKAPTVLARKWMMSIAWRAAWVIGKITGRKPLITRESVANADIKQLFDGSKITREFGFSYRPIKTSIKDVGELYLKQKMKP
jgi:nucleoside-diphosphate-sugar epimerase